MEEKYTQFLILTEDELKLFSEFLDWKENRYSENVVNSIDDYTDRQKEILEEAKETLPINRMNALSDAYDKDINDWKKLRRRNSSIGSSVVGTTWALGKGLKRPAKHIILDATAGAIVGSLAGRGITAAHKSVVNGARKKNPDFDKELQEKADLYRVLSGDMTKKQFIKKHNKNKKNKKKD